LLQGLIASNRILKHRTDLGKYVNIKIKVKEEVVDRGERDLDLVEVNRDTIPNPKELIELWSEYSDILAKSVYDKMKIIQKSSSNVSSKFTFGIYKNAYTISVQGNNQFSRDSDKFIATNVIEDLWPELDVSQMLMVSR
jgi:hypothetical protein